MNLAFLAKKDLWAGLLLIAIGAAAVAIARNYPFGTALRMGPGYLPVVLGALLILFGIAILAAGLAGSDKLPGAWPLRALIVLPLSLALFGFLVDRAGFVPALMVLVFGSATASHEFRPVEALLLAAGLTALAVAVFVYALGLPYPLLAGFG
jgi:hypothetical protein